MMKQSGAFHVKVQDLQSTKLETLSIYIYTYIHGGALRRVKLTKRWLNKNTITLRSRCCWCHTSYGGYWELRGLLGATGATGSYGGYWELRRLLAATGATGSYGGYWEQRPQQLLHSEPHNTRCLQPAAALPPTVTPRMDTVIFPPVWEKWKA